MKRIGIILLLIMVVGGGIFLYCDSTKVGEEIDSYKGVPVYYNGVIFTKSYGKHFSKDGYYFGQKWQCVEYVKRFYYQEKGHRMPNVMGHAKDFFDPDLPPGELNQARGLVQYVNGGEIKPETDDLIVFSDTKFGHVAIVTKVGSGFIEVVQQNILGRPRERFALEVQAGHYSVGTKRKPAGWLRKE